jgi:hypothetical protein
LPDKAIAEWFPNGFPHTYLAYVEWFSPFPKYPDPNHQLFKIARSFKDEQRYASIIPVKNICRSVHLFPSFKAIASRNWTSNTVLDLCQTFFVNSTSDRYIYATCI